MAVKIRLARYGKKDYAFFHIIVADSRSPQSGKFIEKIGTYNPNANPAAVELNFESALNWLNKGAQPTNTVRAILSYKGVLLKKHLDGGVKKGVFTAETAEERLAAWLDTQERKIQTKKDALVRSKQKNAQQRLDTETKTKEARAEQIALKRKAALDAEAAAAPKEQTEETAAEAATPATANATNE